MGKRTVLAISGSLRARSSNSAVVSAVARVAPAEAEVAIYGGLGDLPHFNPDLDRDPLPAPVADLRGAVRGADALLICSPEYAHGVPGAMKNGLDWLVSSGELMGKPVGLVNSSPGSTHAQASLAETLRVLMAELVPGGSIALPLSRNSMTADDIANDPALASALRAAVMALVNASQALAE